MLPGVTQTNAFILPCEEVIAIVSNPFFSARMNCSTALFGSEEIIFRDFLNRF
jgi:hypothetical protein